MILIFIALVSSQKLGGPMIPFFFFRTKSWSAFIRFGITQKSGFISISFFFRVIIGSIVIGFRIWAAVKILATTLEEIVPLPVGIVEVNFTLVLINTDHF